MFLPGGATIGTLDKCQMMRMQSEVFSRPEGSNLYMRTKFPTTKRVQAKPENKHSDRA